MILIPTNLVTLPLMVLAAAANACLFLIAVRLAVPQTPHTTTLVHALAQLTDPLHRFVHERLQAVTGRNVWRWVSWVLLIAILLAARHYLLRLLIDLGR